MDYHINFGIWGSIFAVPTRLIDRHIKLCSEIQLKVLLMALRFGEDTIDTKKIAEALSLTVENVEDCLSYWETTDIFSGGVAEAPLEPKVLYEEDNLAAVAHTENKPKKMPTQENNVPLQTTYENKNDKNQKIITQHSRTHLTPAQITEMSLRDPNVPMLMNELQQQLSRTISPADQEEFLYYYSYLNLEPGYMLMVVAYCLNNNKTSMHAITNEIKSWVENGIDTLELAENYIIKLDKRTANENYVKEIFNVTNRNLTKSEKECSRIWYEDYNLDNSLVSFASERTMDITGKSSIAYANKMLENWVNDGIRTVPQAIENIKQYETQKTAPISTAKRTVNKLDKTMGNSSFDLSDIEKVLKKNMEL